MSAGVRERLSGALAEARSLLYRRNGPLSSELHRTHGTFGVGQLPERLAPDATAPLVCGFCSTGCLLEVHLRDGLAVNVRPDPDYPVNRGSACPKGWQALAPLGAPDRATVPLLSDKRGRHVPVSWQRALSVFVRRMKAVQERHGRHAVAFLGSGQLPTEELALLGALAKFGMGLMHGDGNTRQCMATAVSAYKEAFGFDAPPYAYADFEESDLIVLVGSNLCIAHPILWERVCRNQRQAEIVVVDPRRTETAMAATQHLAPRPKTDLALFYGLANWLCQNGAVAEGFVREHTLGFEAFRAHVAEYSLERTSDITGLPVEQIERLALSIRRAERVSFWWTMGINQSHQGVRTAQALINLALMTGNIGRPGTGANSITGQCNAMGSRLFANTTNLLGGHDFKNPSDRKKVAETLGISADRIPDNAGFAYDQIMEGIVRGKIKALWVAGTNTAHSWINQADALDALRRLEFLVVQDMYFTTETAALAHLVLPAAGWGEKEGTFINSERRLARIRKVSRPPGQALPDFYIFKLIAEAWGVGDLFRRWSHPEAVFQILKELSREQPCDISGIRDYSMLDECGGVQWPFRAGDVASAGSERRLFCDGRFYHADGKARFCFESPRPLPEVTSQAYPLALLTGRGTSAQWHTQTRTGKVQLLNELGPQDPYVELSPIDARALGVAPDEWVLVESQRGRFCARAHVTHVVRPGEVFVPMHYPKANQLTLGAFDPYSRQPAYKFAAVRVRRLTAEERPSTGPFNRFNTTS